MFRFISRIFGGASAVQTNTNASTAPGSPASAAPAGAPAVVVRATSPWIDRDEVGEWIPQDAGYWLKRTAYVIGRLRKDWEEEPDAHKWPNVVDVLDLLAGAPEEIVRQLPAAARDAMALCDKPGIRRSELGDHLSRDPSLVQGLLRQANGAFYGSGLAPILRVDSAIDRIGVAGTRGVVMASCIEGLLSKPGGAYDVMLASVWGHMVNCGPLARALARSLGADPEEAFCIALLHDVGKLVFFDRISSLRTSKRKAVALPDAWLSLALEQLHEPLGAIAAHRWGLGARAADAIGAHHRRQRPALRHPLAETLFLAERAEHAARDRAVLDYEGLASLGQLPGDPMRFDDILGRHLHAA